MNMSYTATASIRINALLKKVWVALTVPEQVKVYFFGSDLITDWKVGSPIFFRGEWDGKPYEDKGHVLSFEPEKTLSYDYWSALSGIPDKPELYQIIRYDLREESDGVEVTFTQSNVDTQENADRFSKNWDMVLKELKKFLEK